MTTTLSSCPNPKRWCSVKPRSASITRSFSLTRTSCRLRSRAIGIASSWLVTSPSPPPFSKVTRPGTRSRSISTARTCLSGRNSQTVRGKSSAICTTRSQPRNNCVTVPSLLISQPTLRAVTGHTSLVTSSQLFLLEQHRVLDVSSLTVQERKLYEINHDLTRNHRRPVRRRCTAVPRRRSTLHRQMEAQPLQEQTRRSNDDRARRRKPLHSHLCRYRRDRDLV